jgi:hypothetical protein
LNTPVPPDTESTKIDQPGWLLSYADGSVFRGVAGDWMSQATLERVDEISVYTTTKLVESLVIFDEESPYLCWIIRLPEPLPVFAFARFSSLLGVGTTHWHYSVFGYLYQGLRFLFYVYPDHTMASVTPRSEPFLL